MNVSVSDSVDFTASTGGGAAPSPAAPPPEHVSLDLSRAKATGASMRNLLAAMSSRLPPEQRASRRTQMDVDAERAMAQMMSPPAGPPKQSAWSSPLSVPLAGRREEGERERALAETNVRARRRSVVLVEEDMRNAASEAAYARLHSRRSSNRPTTAGSGSPGALDAADTADVHAVTGEDGFLMSARSSVLTERGGGGGGTSRGGSGAPSAPTPAATTSGTGHVQAADAMHAGACHVLVVNAAVAQRAHMKQWAKQYKLKISFPASTADACEALASQRNAFTAVLADTANGSASVHTLLNTLRAERLEIPVFVVLPPPTGPAAAAATAGAAGTASSSTGVSSMPADGSEPSVLSGLGAGGGNGATAAGQAALSMTLASSLPDADVAQQTHIIETFTPLGVAAFISHPVPWDELAMRLLLISERAASISAVFQSVRGARERFASDRSGNVHRKELIEGQFKTAVTARRSSHASARANVSALALGSLPLSPNTAALGEAAVSAAEREWYPADEAQRVMSPRDLAALVAAREMDRHESDLIPTLTARSARRESAERQMSARTAPDDTAASAAAAPSSMPTLRRGASTGRMKAALSASSSMPALQSPGSKSRSGTPLDRLRSPTRTREQFLFASSSGGGGGMGSARFSEDELQAKALLMSTSTASLDNQYQPALRLAYIRQNRVKPMERDASEEDEDAHSDALAGFLDRFLSGDESALDMRNPVDRAFLLPKPSSPFTLSGGGTVGAALHTGSPYAVVAGGSGEAAAREGAAASRGSRRRRSVVVDSILAGSLAASAQAPPPGTAGSQARSVPSSAAGSVRAVARLGTSASVPALPLGGASSSSKSTAKLLSASAWRPSGPAQSDEKLAATRAAIESLNMSREAMLERRAVRAKANLQAHQESAAQYFAVREALQDIKEARQTAKTMTAVENNARRDVILKEVRQLEERVGKGETWCEYALPDAHLPTAYERWMFMDELKGDLREPRGPELEHITRAQTLMHRGVSKRDAGDDVGALELYSAALKLDANSVWARLLRGCAHYRLKRFDAALKDFQTCVASKATRSMALFNRALTHACLGNWSDTFKDLNSVLMTNPSDAEALRFRGLLQRRLGRFTAAFHDYSTVKSVLSSSASSRTLAPSAGERGSDSGSGLPPVAPRPAPSSARAQAGSPTRALAASSQEAVYAEVQDIISGTTDVFTRIFASDSVLQSALRATPGARTADQVGVIRSALLPLFFYRALSTAMQEQMAEAMQYCEYAEGEQIVAEGAEARYFYIVLTGECAARVQVSGSTGAPASGASSTGVPAASGLHGGGSGDASAPAREGSAELVSEFTVDTLQAGDYFGHLSMLFGASRTLSMIVKSPYAHIMQLPRMAFYRVGLDEVFISDLERRQAALRATGAFHSWSDVDLLKLACVAKYRPYRKQAVIIRQGDMPSELLILIKGIVGMYKASDAVADLQMRIAACEGQLKYLKTMFTYHAELRGMPARHGKSMRSLLCPPLASGSGADSLTLAAAADRASGSRQSGRAAGGVLGATLRMRWGGADPEELSAAQVVATSLSLHQGHADDADLPVTFAENYAAELTVQLQDLNEQLSALRVRERERSASQGGSSVGAGGSASLPTLAPLASVGKAATSLSGVHGAVRAKVDSLYPTSLLSAVVVTNPWHGFEAGDFVAETYAEVMALPKTQLDQRMFTKERVQALVEHTPVFPNDGLVLDKAAAEKEWQRFRKYTVDRIDKTAWPLAQHGARIKFLHGGRQLVVPDKVAQAAAAARAP